MEQEIQLNEQECLPTCMADFNPTLNDIIIYQTEDGEIKLDVKMDKETVWLTQAQMSDLFQTDRTAILRHINNIYKSQELESESTCAKIARVLFRLKQQHAKGRAHPAAHPAPWSVLIPGPCAGPSPSRRR